MSTLAQRHNLESADVLLAPKSSFNIVKHMIVFLWIDAFGQDHYLENHPQFGVRHLTGLEVETLYKIIAVKRFPGTQKERQLAIQRAVSLEGKKYELFKFNCEHFANYVQTKTIFSQQSNNAVGFAVLGLAAVVLSRL
jgi:hypothetical protein